jgi:hypothetical protein
MNRNSLAALCLLLPILSAQAGRLEEAQEAIAGRALSDQFQLLSAPVRDASPLIGMVVPPGPGPIDQRAYADACTELVEAASAPVADLQVQRSGRGQDQGQKRAGLVFWRGSESWTEQQLAEDGHKVTEILRLELAPEVTHRDLQRCLERSQTTNLPRITQVVLGEQRVVARQSSQGSDRHRAPLHGGRRSADMLLSDSVQSGPGGAIAASTTLLYSGGSPPSPGGASSSSAISGDNGSGLRSCSSTGWYSSHGDPEAPEVVGISPTACPASKVGVCRRKAIEDALYQALIQYGGLDLDSSSQTGVEMAEADEELDISLTATDEMKAWVRGRVGGISPTDTCSNLVGRPDSPDGPRYTVGVLVPLEGIEGLRLP